MIGFKNFLIEEGKKKGTGFGCIMLMYNSEFKKEFSKITSQICPDDLYKPEDGFGVETEPHVTVKYGLHEQDHKKVFDILGNVPPISVKLAKSASLFENEEFDVVKIKISGSELRALNKRVCNIFEYTDKFKDYNPHTTIAYVKPGMGKKYIKELDSKLFGSFVTISRLCYSDSNSNKKFIYLK